MKKFIFLILVLFIAFTLNGCFLGGHINSSGNVGVSVGGSVF